MSGQGVHIDGVFVEALESWWRTDIRRLINKRGHRSSLLFLGSEFDVIERLVKLIYNHTFHLTFNVEWWYFKCEFKWTLQSFCCKSRCRVIIILVLNKRHCLHGWILIEDKHKQRYHKYSTIYPLTSDSYYRLQKHAIEYRSKQELRGLDGHCHF